MSNNYTPSKELLDSLKSYEGWHDHGNASLEELCVPAELLDFTYNYAERLI